ncbi:Thiamin ABC transporter, substrate-binding component [hydrothermal vent metagenome]|uniref:Thiamin ABC transporter, substrate-binding component n=1 Tax=hydrothermal vent metagenome TaxID=652676 RepID=A0A3B0UFT3_9ZZZZ
MKRWLIYLSLLGTAVTACTSPDPTVITLMTHDSFAISEATLAQFEAENGVTVELLPAGDAGAALNQAILAKEAPLADVFFGVDNSFMGRALAANIFEPYQSPLLSQIPDELALDSENRLLPVDYGDVCLNYDKAWVAENELPLPQNLAALTDPIYEGLLVVENPATSSPGLAFLLATIAEFGEDGYLEYWVDLRENDVLVTNGWEEAYYGSFSVASDGERPFVVSYASSPPAEVVFSDPPLDEAPSASLVAAGMCFRQIEFVGILVGTEKREMAEKLVDFMLSQTFQEDMPLNMFVYPANENAVLPDVFVEWTQVPQETAVIDPEKIDANRERWIEAWTEVVLR